MPSLRPPSSFDISSLILYADFGFAGSMPSSKKRRKFNAAQAARRVAREIVGQPPVERVIPDKRRKAPKHRKPLTADELSS